MRRAAVIPVLALLLVTGCSTATAEAEEKPSPPSPPSASPAATASAAAASGDTEEQACLRLLGTDGQGPLTRLVSAVKVGGGVSSVELTAEEARPLHEDVLAIAKDASTEMAPLVKVLSSSTENVIMQAENPSRAWTFNAEEWTAASAELQTRCEPYGTIG